MLFFVFLLGCLLCGNCIYASDVGEVVKDLLREKVQQSETFYASMDRLNSLRRAPRMETWEKRHVGQVASFIEVNGYVNEILEDIPGQDKKECDELREKLSHDTVMAIVTMERLRCKAREENKH
ncbi:MAG: hypothetical protein WD055_05985 [Candidatus Dependentiae bacterium]